MCKFAEEITTQRDVLSTSENSLAAFMSTVLPQSLIETPAISSITGCNDNHLNQKMVGICKAWPIMLGFYPSNDILVGKVLCWLSYYE